MWGLPLIIISQSNTMPIKKHKNIRWHGGALGEGARAKHLGQAGAVVWLTGLSGSGKSTVARALEKALVEKGVSAAVLDGDNLRFGLNKDPDLLQKESGYSAAAASERCGATPPTCRSSLQTFP